MIGILRKHSKTLFIIIIIVPIVVSFVFWGAGRSRALKREDPAMGEINGKKILLSQLREAAAVINLTQQAKSNQQLESMIWRHMLMMEEAKNWGITVSKTEISRFVKGLFGGEEEFDHKLYQQYLAGRRISTTDFEEWIRQSAITYKIQGLVASSTLATQDEVRIQYDLANTKIKLKYHKIETGKLVSALTNIGEAKEYYLKNPDKFMRPRRARVLYVVIGTQKFLKNAPQFSDRELANYHKHHGDDFKDENGNVQPLDAVKTRVREALKKQYAFEQARKKAKSLFKDADPARIQQIANANGLELRLTGLVGDGEYVDDYLENNPAFVKQALKTDVGGFSPAIDTEKGVVVLLPLEIIEEGPAEFLEVADEISENLQQQEERNNIAAVEKRAAQIKDCIDSGYNVQGISKSNYTNIASKYLKDPASEEFNMPQKRRVMYILIDPKDKNRFKLKDAVSEEDIKNYYHAHKQEFIDEDSGFKPFAEVSEDVKSGIEQKLREKYVITSNDIEQYYEENSFLYKDINDSPIPLAEVEQEIAGILEKQKKRSLAGDLAQEIFVIYRPERMRWLADRNNLPIRETGLFGVMGDIDDYVGDSLEFKKAAFLTEVGDVSPIIETEKGFAILSPIEQRPVDPTPAALANIFDEIREKETEKEALQLAVDVATNQLNAVKQGMNNSTFDNACRALGIRPVQTEWFSRIDSEVTGLGPVQNLAFTVGEKIITPFEMQPDEISLLHETEDGALFYVVADTKIPTDEEFEEEKEKNLSRILVYRSQQVVTEWLRRLQDKYNLQVYKKN